MAGAVEFVISEPDYVGAVQDAFLVLLRSRAGKRRIAFSTLFWIGLGFAIGWIQGGLAAAGDCCLLLAAGGLLLQALVYGLCYLRLPHHAARLYRQESRRDAPVSITWDERGVRIESATADTRYAWSDLYRWAVGRRAVLLYQNELLYNFVPLRVLDASARDTLTVSLEEARVPRG